MILTLNFYYFIIMNLTFCFYGGWIICDISLGLRASVLMESQSALVETHESNFQFQSKADAERGSKMLMKMDSPSDEMRLEELDLSSLAK